VNSELGSSCGAFGMDFFWWFSVVEVVAFATGFTLVYSFDLGGWCRVELSGCLGLACVMGLRGVPWHWVGGVVSGSFEDSKS